MENASKALIMAGEILLGVMLISIAVYAFNHFGGYSKETNQKIEDVQIAEFNQQFLKFYGQTEYPGELGNMEKDYIRCTIHDIVSLANLAKKNNTEYELLRKKRTFR